MKRFVDIFRKKDLCSGCAYKNGNMRLQCNCVGCEGFVHRPHYVPAGENAPANWWEYVRIAATKEGK